MVDVAPSPVTGAPEGVPIGVADGEGGEADGEEGWADGEEGWADGEEGEADGEEGWATTSVAVPELPLEQSMDGL